jgi:hypothetical protein
MTQQTRFSAFLGLTCCALVITATALAGLATTTVTIVGPDSVYGYVHSASTKCLGGRKVKVYKQKGSMHNPSVDKLMASTMSEREGRKGRWDLGNPGFPHGRYYAEVTRTTHCAGAFSKTVKFS